MHLIRHPPATMPTTAHQLVLHVYTQHLPFPPFPRTTGPTPEKHSVNEACCVGLPTYSSAGYFSKLLSVPAMSPPSCSKYNRNRFISRASSGDRFFFVGLGLEEAAAVVDGGWDAASNDQHRAKNCTRAMK